MYPMHASYLPRRRNYVGPWLDSGGQIRWKWQAEMSVHVDSLTVKTSDVGFVQSSYSFFLKVVLVMSG